MTEEELVEKAWEAFNAASTSPKMVACDRCDGRGFHHGFGEDGHDPDWCLSCGGGGWQLAEGEEDKPMRAVLSLVRPIIERETLERAAKVAERQGHIDWEDGDGGMYGAGYENACEEIAAAIRALAEGE